MVQHVGAASSPPAAGYTHPNHSGDVTSVADGATTIAAKAVDVAMLADGTDGELITWDAAGVAAVVASGTAAQVLTSNGAGAAPTFQAVAAGAVTREGGNTTEATTTSLTAVSLLAAASLTILAAEPFSFRYGGRKSAGVAARGVCGTSLNATTIAEAHTTTNVDAAWFSSTTDRAEFGSAHFLVAGRVTNYDYGIDGWSTSKVAAGTSATNSQLISSTKSAAMPIATITDLAVRGISGAALVTLGADELQIYSYAAS